MLGEIGIEFKLLDSKLSTLDSSVFRKSFIKKRL